MCKICNGEPLEGLQYLMCSSCPLLTSILVIEGLHELYCWNCPLLTNIPEGFGRNAVTDEHKGSESPVIEGLQILNCSYCHLLTSIPVIE